MRFPMLISLLVLDVTIAQMLERRSPCSTDTYDKVLLKRVTLLSKYIFTGKVFGASVAPNGTTYKVNIRRVLKGDLDDIGVVVKFGTAKSLRFSDATVFVKSFQVFQCRPLRKRTYGIFLTERGRAKSLELSLVVEPLVLTLQSLEIVEAAVKGWNATIQRDLKIETFITRLAENMFRRSDASSYSHLKDLAPRYDRLPNCRPYARELLPTDDDNSDITDTEPEPETLGN